MVVALAMLASSFALCCILIHPARHFAMHWGLVDRPDAGRKLHRRPTPVAGGLVVFLSCTLVLGAGYLVPHSLQDYLFGDAVYVFGLLLACAFLCAVGVLDDLGWLRARYKMIGQVAAVCIVMLFGVRVSRIEMFGFAVDLGVWAMPFTLLWLLGAINSLNLIDGVDGMLGCVGLFICLAMAGMALLGGQWAAACVAAALAGALLGFLCFNWPPATIFMGDAGSMTVGLVVGVLGIQCSLKSTATATLIAPLVVLTIPIFDTAAAILRRKLTGRSIYDTDRGHIHHCLLQQGFSPRMVLAVVSLFSIIAVVSALGSLALKSELIAVCGAMTVVTVLITTKLFGYQESQLIRRRIGHLLESMFEKKGEGTFRRIDLHIQGGAGWDRLLNVLSSRAVSLKLQGIVLDVRAAAAHEEYHGSWERHDRPESATLWCVELPLQVSGRDVARLQITGRADPEPVWSKVAALTELIEEFVADELKDVFLSGAPLPGSLQEQQQADAPSGESRSTRNRRTRSVIVEVDVEPTPPPLVLES